MATTNREEAVKASAYLMRLRPPAAALSRSDCLSAGVETQIHQWQMAVPADPEVPNQHETDAPASRGLSWPRAVPGGYRGLTRGRDAVVDASAAATHRSRAAGRACEACGKRAGAVAQINDGATGILKDTRRASWPLFIVAGGSTGTGCVGRLPTQDVELHRWQARAGEHREGWLAPQRQ